MSGEPAAPTEPGVLEVESGDSASEDFKNLGEIINSLLNEATLSRVRHRALLAVLMGGKPFTWQEYTSSYERILGEDGEGIFMSLALKDEAFRKRYDAWRQADLKKYGYILKKRAD
ncbi:MAG: hypothetical protein ACREMP_06550 [Candidatus Tyrphobacter sp.]